MPFLLPNQQCQSTEGDSTEGDYTWITHVTLYQRGTRARHLSVCVAYKQHYHICIVPEQIPAVQHRLSSIPSLVRYFCAGIISTHALRLVTSAGNGYLAISFNTHYPQISEKSLIPGKIMNKI